MLDVKATPVFDKLWNSKSKIVCSRGGTRSSKTYSLCQLFILKALSENNKRIIVARKSFNTIRKTTYYDFKQVMEDLGVSGNFKINMTNLHFRCYKTNSTIEFASCDDTEKWKGLSANYFWFNEATEIPRPFFQQAILRLDRKSGDGKMNQFYLDFNPSFATHWIKKLEEDRDDIDIIISSYKDNPFLMPDVIDEIQALEQTDIDMWLVYGLGMWGEVRGAIFRNWKLTPSFPDDCEKVWFGLDWGFTNDFTAVVKVGLKAGEIYLHEILHRRELTNPDISRLLFNKLQTKSIQLICDSSEPKSIEELRRMGWRYARGADKGQGSIMRGIDILKRYKINITKTSVNVIDEFTNYQWKENKDGEAINTPIDRWNHCIDAIRYVALLFLKKKGSGKIWIY